MPLLTRITPWCTPPPKTHLRGNSGHLPTRDAAIADRNPEIGIASYEPRRLLVHSAQGVLFQSIQKGFVGQTEQRGRTFALPLGLLQRLLQQ